MSPETEAKLAQAASDLYAAAPDSFTPEDKSHFAQHLPKSNPGSLPQGVGSTPFLRETLPPVTSTIQIVRACPTLPNPEKHLAQTCKMLNIEPNQILDPTTSTSKPESLAAVAPATKTDDDTEPDTEPKTILTPKPKSRYERYLAFKTNQSLKSKPPP